MRESDGPEDVWVREHGDELVGLREEDAEAVVIAAGFRAAVFRPAPGRALALAKWRNTVTLFSHDGVITRVQA